MVLILVQCSVLPGLGDSMAKGTGFISIGNISVWIGRESDLLLRQSRCCLTRAICRSKVTGLRRGNFSRVALQSVSTIVVGC